MSDHPLKSSHEDLKKQLAEDSDQIKQQIRSELHGVTDQFRDIATNALLVGGATALGYWLVQKVGPWKSKKIGQHRSRFRKAGESLLQVFMIYLLSLAREKLVAYLETLDNDDQIADLNAPGSDTDS